MKKTTVLTVLLVIAAFLAVCFCSLWLRELTDYSDMEELCQYYASGAAGTLEEYAHMKEEFGQDHMSTYWYGVSRFYAFMDTLRVLPDPGGWNEAMYKACKVLYDHMLLDPDQVLAHMDEVLAVLELLGEDYTSPDARRALAQLSECMQYDLWEAAAGQ